MASFLLKWEIIDVIILLGDYMLEVKNIFKQFKMSKKQMKIEGTDVSTKKAVNGVSFKVTPGEIFGLLGPNGAGKTTSLRCIATLFKPDSGEIYVNNIDAIKEDDKVRSKICFLTNELKLEEHFSPDYTFNYFGKLYDLSEEVIEKRKKLLFEKFEISKFREVKIKELSTGMKQKLSIAVSLVHDPEVIIFDEPTNGLDVLTAKVVTDYLQELREQGKTIIISTHIMTVASKLCDRIGVLIDGEIAAQGTVEEILKLTNTSDMEEAFFELYRQRAVVRGEI